jgi:uncharacterized Zn finger protein
MKLGGANELKGDYKEAANAYRKVKEKYATTPEGQGVEKYLARAEAMSEAK